MSVEWGTTSGPEGNASAMWYRGGTGWCNAGEYVVVTERMGNNAGAPTHSAEADDVSFTIIVP